MQQLANMLKDKKYKASFGGSITKIAGADVDKYISLAGLDNLKRLMPDGVSLDNNPDILAVALNAAVGNLCNKNFDAITNETAASIASSFVWKYVNIGHDRSTCVGVICNYGFSDFVSNKLVTAEETKTSTEPVNISLVCLLWKGTLGDKAIELIEASADSTSDKYGSVSASWELYFDDYDIAVGKTKNIADCQIYSGESKGELEKYLVQNKGTGKMEDNYVFRVLNKDGIISAGIGLVSQPAAEVEGLVIINEAEKKETPQISESSVTNQYTMKYKFLEKISESSLQASLAGELDVYVQSELDKVAKDYQLKVDQAKSSEADINQKLQAANDSLAQVNEKLKQLEAELAKTQSEANETKAKLEAKAKEDAYNSRMAEFDNTYELSADHRKILASRLNKVQDENEFVALKNEMAILLASVNKETLSKAKQTSTASVKTSDTSVSDALENSDKKVTLPNSSVNDSKAKSYSERIDSIFSKDNVKITIK